MFDAFISLGICLAIFPIGMIVFSVVQDKYRHKKYPRYFELYKVAIDGSKQAGDYFVKNIEPFDSVLTIFNKAHEDKIISDEQFSTLIPIFEDTFNTYKNKYESMQSDVSLLWQAVNKYAVDHNLKWGEVL